MWHSQHPESLARRRSGVPESGVNAFVTAGFSFDTATNRPRIVPTVRSRSPPAREPSGATADRGWATDVAVEHDHPGRRVARARRGADIGDVWQQRWAAPSLDPNAFASQVVLLPGSITSVSMNGLTVRLADIGRHKLHVERHRADRVHRADAAGALDQRANDPGPGGSNDRYQWRRGAGRGRVHLRPRRFDGYFASTATCVDIGREDHPTVRRDQPRLRDPAGFADAPLPARHGTALYRANPAVGSQIVLGSGVPGCRLVVTLCSLAATRCYRARSGRDRDHQSHGSVRGHRVGDGSYS